jgi:hypothetical protein
MKRLLTLTIIGICLLGTTLNAGQGRGEQKRLKRPAVRATNAVIDVDVAFTARDVGVIRQHYAPRYRRLPPGLRKKLARGESLPPGWRTKVEPFPYSVERNLPPLPRGYRRGVLDGHAVIYSPQRQVIVDLAILF